MECGNGSVTSRRKTAFPAPFRPLLEALLLACRQYYGDRLVALAVFGSLGRGTAGPESDVDLLIVCRDLPAGRIPRIEEFCSRVEPALETLLRQLSARGIHTRLSPVFKTPEELEVGSPLLLDMVEDAVILDDPEGILAGRLRRLQERLAELGARRVWQGDQWYWDLKPDYRPGEVFEL